MASGPANFHTLSPCSNRGNVFCGRVVLSARRPEPEDDDGSGIYVANGLRGEDQRWMQIWAAARFTLGRFLCTAALPEQRSSYILVALFSRATQNDI